MRELRGLYFKYLHDNYWFWGLSMPFSGILNITIVAQVAGWWGDYFNRVTWPIVCTVMFIPIYYTFWRIAITFIRNFKKDNQKKGD